MNDLDLLISAARAAGDIATQYWRKSPKVWEKDADAGPVTEADLSVNAMLNETLIGARPDYGWLSEETEDNAARLNQEYVFIIDPIDGTRSFIAGEKTWAHSLAVARNGEIVSAVVYLPISDKLYHAQIGLGAFLNNQPIRATNVANLKDATVLAAHPNFEADHWINGPPLAKRHFRPSLAYRMALVAQGRFDAMLTLRDTWEWDVAAGTLIATEAGAIVTDNNGNAPVFNNKTPALSGLIAGGSHIHHELYSQLA